MSKDIEGVLTIGDDGKIWFNDKTGVCRLRIQGLDIVAVKKKVNVNQTIQMIDIRIDK